MYTVIMYTVITYFQQCIRCKRRDQKWFASMNVTDHLQVLHFDGMCAQEAHILPPTYHSYYIESSKKLYL